MDGIYPLGVLQKAHSEALADGDNNAIMIVDLILEMKSEAEKCIYKIDLCPFGIILINTMALKILKNEEKVNKDIRLHIDATSGILSKPAFCESSILHHVIVAPIKSSVHNKHSTVLHVAELITENQESLNVELFLRTLFKINEVANKCSMSRVFVTDKSFAALNAIMKCANEMSMTKYLAYTHQICIGEKRIDERELTLVMLCSSHLSKNWTAEIRHHYGGKGINRDVRRFLSAIIGELMNRETYQELVDYVKLVMVILLSRRRTPRFKGALKDLKTLLSDVDNNDENDDDDDENEGGEIDENTQGHIEMNSKAIYKRSPFFKQFNKYKTDILEELEELEEDDENSGAKENVLFSINYVDELLKKTFAYTPFWSATLLRLRQPLSMIYQRPNNGTIEGYFGRLKQALRQDHALPRIGKIKPARYVRYLKTRNEANAKVIIGKLPDIRQSRTPARAKRVVEGNETEETVALSSELEK
jgi:hypothetical protein